MAPLDLDDSRSAQRGAKRQVVKPYLECQRHILLDMHIPDFAEGFMRDFDPVATADLYAHAGADAVMVYANSHAGQCFWPTKSGRMHAGLGARDVFGETVDLLHERGIAVCAYYSSHFNNWAYAEHPSWRMVASGPGSLFAQRGRYGLCCPNNPEYHAFQLAQTDEVCSSYGVDAVFFDMVFWPEICACEHCLSRWGGPLPATVDWFDAEWCRFQDARESWLAGRHAELAACVRSHLDVPVFCNGATLPTGWRWAPSGKLLAHGDLIGGDYGAGRDELYAYCHLISRRSPSVMQYMNATSGYIGGASHIKPLEDQITHHALVASLFRGQYMAIDAVQPGGSVNPGFYDRLRQVFDAMRPHEDLLGGDPIADVGVYWSLKSQVHFGENGTPRKDALVRQRPSPHLDAVVGAVAALRDAGLPVGVVTEDGFDDVAVLVLPNVLRLDAAECEAIRRYVERGGRLLATGWTSLVSADGVKHDDFVLADLFGCHYAGTEECSVAYLRGVEQWIAPLRSMAFAGAGPRITADPDAEVLARLTLPFGTGRGTKDDREWASVHASPPWRDTDHPVIVRRGAVVYSSADIDALSATAANEAARGVLVGLVRSLMPRPFTYEVESDAGVWAVGFRDDDGVRVNLLNLVPHRPAPRVCVGAVEVRDLERFEVVHLS